MDSPYEEVSRVQAELTHLLSLARTEDRVVGNFVDWCCRHINSDINVVIYTRSDDSSGRFNCTGYVNHLDQPFEHNDLFSELSKKLIRPMADRKMESVSISPGQKVDPFFPHLKRFRGYHILAFECRYIDTVMALMVFFSKEPITNRHRTLLFSSRQFFVAAYLGVSDQVTRKSQRSRNDKDEADWWKRGENPPY